jgi:adenylate kinase family enzyme
MIILIIPIGSPGSGKTTLQKYLNTRLPNYFFTERDEEFASLRKTNSLKKTRKKLFDDFQNFLENIENLNQKNPEIIYYVYLDSSNAKTNVREKFYQKLNPDKIIELNFSLKNSVLQDRVRTRYHPTFPTNPDKQVEMINIISNNIEFSNPNDHRITKIYVNEPETLDDLYQKIIKV